MTDYSTATADDCICPPDTHHGGYVVGCRYHVALQMLAGPVVSTKGAGVHVVEFFHAEITLSTPVLRTYDDGDVVASQSETITCDHNHDTIDAAERCAARLARKHGAR
jgi:hypothetical protein